MVEEVVGDLLEDRLGIEVEADLGAVPAGVAEARSAASSFATVPGGKVQRDGTVEGNVQVEIWSDVSCPWCYVGTVRFEEAVARTGADVEVVYRAFELDPGVPGRRAPARGLPRGEVR